jgi:non-specific serine/threonine protein kinase
LEVLTSQSSKHLVDLIAGEVPAASLLGKVMQEQTGRRVIERRPVLVPLGLNGPEPVPDVSLSTNPAEGREASRPPTFAWRGDGWQVAFRDQEFTLKPSVGTERLAKLLREPGREFSAEQLDAPQLYPRDTAGPAASLLGGGFHVESGRRSEPVIDAITVEQCEEAVAEHEAKRLAAIERGDIERATELAELIETIRAYLASASGLRGKIRQQPGPATKRRRAVKTSIDRSIEAIRRHHRKLGTHLDHSLLLSNGKFSYTPPEPVDWTVEIP